MPGALVFAGAQSLRKEAGGARGARVTMSVISSYSCRQLRRSETVAHLAMNSTPHRSVLPFSLSAAAATDWGSTRPWAAGAASTITSRRTRESIPLARILAQKVPASAPTPRGMRLCLERTFSRRWARKSTIEYRISVASPHNQPPLEHKREVPNREYKSISVHTAPARRPLRLDRARIPEAALGAGAFAALWA